MTSSSTERFVDGLIRIITRNCRKGLDQKSGDLAGLTRNSEGASFRLYLRRTALIPIVMFVLGCSSWENPVDPSVLPTESAPQFIKLPKGNSLPKRIKVTELVTPERGGKLKLKFKYRTDSTKVKIDIVLEFPKGALSESTYVSLAADDKVLMTNIDLLFGPHMNFVKAAKLKVDAKGLDLSGLPSKCKLKLYFVNDNESWEEIKTKKIKVKIPKGEIECEGGEIEHFSRYAFGF